MVSFTKFILGTVDAVGGNGHWPVSAGTWLWLCSLEAARSASHAPQSWRVCPNVSGSWSIHQRHQLDSLGRHGWTPMGRSDYGSSGDPWPQAEISRRISQQCCQSWCSGCIRTVGKQFDSTLTCIHGHLWEFWQGVKVHTLPFLSPLSMDHAHLSLPFKSC